ncbi:MAG: SDR family oxidoreductase [Promethearchaeota archaeon]
MDEKILVTGATGTVGSEVIRSLIKLKIPVRAAVRDISSAKKMFGDEVKYVRFDFGKSETFGEALINIEKLFLVRPPPISDVKKYIFPLIDYAKNSGVTHIVFLSLMGVNRLMPHYKIEKYMETSGINYTHLRANFFMQNLSTFYRDIIRDNHEIFIPAGKGKTSFIDVRDIADVAVKVFNDSKYQNGAYTLTGCETLDYFEVAQIFTRVLGKEIIYCDPSAREYNKRMKEMNIPDDFIKVMSRIYFIVRMGKAARITRDTEEILGRKPIKMEKFVQDYSQCWV